MKVGSRSFAVVAAAVLSLIGAGAIVGVSLAHVAWQPLHEAAVELPGAALERERARRAAELARLEQAEQEAVAAAAGNPEIEASENSLLAELSEAEASRDAAVVLVEAAKETLATAIRERNALSLRAKQLEAVAAAASVAPPQSPASAAPAKDPRQQQRATGLPVEITNSIGMKFVVIPAGTFSMGSANGDYDERPVHQVTISKPFYLSAYEVTNADGIAVKRFVSSKWKGDTLPIESVTWEEAEAFCSSLSALPAERAAGRVYRLPTEAEWEYACRAGTTTAYSFGDDESLLGDFAWFGANAGGSTHPVGQKKPNGWGLYDMQGNVWEWCSDRYGDYAAAAATDPQGPAQGSYRVLRGCSWDSSARRCRSADRFRFDPSHRYSYHGFRLALSPSGAGSPEAGE